MNLYELLNKNDEITLSAYEFSLPYYLRWKTTISKKIVKVRFIRSDRYGYLIDKDGNYFIYYYDDNMPELWNIYENENPLHDILYPHHQGILLKHHVFEEYVHKGCGLLINLKLPCISYEK